MEFTLFYTGTIKSGNNSDIRNKNDIRLKIHEQLSNLRNYPPLKSRADLLDKSQYPDFHQNVKGFDYFYLVSGKRDMYVELDLNILIPHGTLSIGDIDNKLKTLFDALRPPKNEQEIPSTWEPAINQKPVFCLLEDDELIYKVNIDTDYLLDTSLLLNYLS